jgi:hypothetical protein
MKTMSSLWGARGGLLAGGLLLVSGVAGLAQSSGTIPIVTLEATDPIGSWAGSAAVFSVLRSGNPATALNVYYCISGTASNGVDYQQIGQWVQLASGVTSNAIVIQPIDHGQTNVETVTLDLCPSMLMSPATSSPINYSIGTPSNATVYIVPSGLPPPVSIVSPTNGAIFYTPTNIELLATAGGAFTEVTNVEFFAGTNDLGRGASVVLDPPGAGGVTGLVFMFDWLKVPTNSYSLTAVATDVWGVAATSAPVKISVLAGPSPTNVPLSVRIVSPPNGSVFTTPVNVPLYAYAADGTSAVTTVEFFAGTNSLGLASAVTAVPPPLPPGKIQPPILIVVPSNYWDLVWSNAPLETNIALTAVATDSAGNTAVSAPVAISVLPAPPPPTNWPPVVNIFATDPVAVEGTNKWVWPGETVSPATWTGWPAAATQMCTNWGPKAGAFTVNRWGDINGDLTVRYGIGGTASNGVDYAAIPGYVTIPSGNRSAAITIVPIDETSPVAVKTVVLTLEASTNRPAEYVVGFPSSAGVIIVEGGVPPVASSVLPDQSFHLVIPGPDAAWYRVEYSTDLTHWTPVCTNQVVNGSINFVDPPPLGDKARYYQAVPMGGP